MKNIVRLSIKLDVVVSDDYLAKLKDDLEFEVSRKCFTNNNRQCISASIEDVEVIDRGITVTKLMNQRYDRDAVTGQGVSDDEIIPSDIDPNEHVPML